jgi:hypothetical protein
MRNKMICKAERTKNKKQKKKKKNRTRTTGDGKRGGGAFIVPEIGSFLPTTHVLEKRNMKECTVVLPDSPREPYHKYSLASLSLFLKYHSN